MQTQPIAILSVTPILDEPAAVEHGEHREWNRFTLMQRSQLLHQALEYLDEDLSEEEFDLIAETEQQFHQKLAACGHIAQKMDHAAELVLAEAEALQRQAKALEQRAAVFANRAERRRQAIRNAMLENNVNKLETPAFTLSLHKTPPKVVQEAEADLSTLDEAYLRIKVEPNRRLIAQELKSGKAVPGFHLSEPELSVRIR